MKKIVLASAAATCMAGMAMAGGAAAPAMDPVIIVDAAVQDSAQGPIVMSVAILAVLATALSH